MQFKTEYKDVMWHLWRPNRTSDHKSAGVKSMNTSKPFKPGRLRLTHLHIAVIDKPKLKCGLLSCIMTKIKIPKSTSKNEKNE